MFKLRDIGDSLCIELRTAKALKVLPCTYSQLGYLLLIVVTTEAAKEAAKDAAKAAKEAAKGAFFWQLHSYQRQHCLLGLLPPPEWRTTPSLIGRTYSIFSMAASHWSPTCVLARS